MVSHTDTMVNKKSISKSIPPKLRVKVLVLLVKNIRSDVSIPILLIDAYSITPFKKGQDFGDISIFLEKRSI